MSRVLNIVCDRRALIACASILVASALLVSGSILSDPDSLLRAVAKNPGDAWNTDGRANGGLAREPHQGDWWKQVSAGVEEMEYRPSRADFGLQAPNRANGFRARFHADGVELVPRTAAQNEWKWSWATCSFGRETCARALAPSAPIQTMSRVEYRRAGFDEWYENGPSGLEQGFTIAQTPAGEGRICIEATIGGSLHAMATHAASAPAAAGPAADDRAAGAQTSGVTFRGPDSRATLHYGGLLAMDASGRELPGEIAFDQDRLRILVDDRGAEYPLIIDPLIASPAWDFLGDQERVVAGRALSTAGDVNGDGFSDVLLGLGSYDNGPNLNQGRVLLFYGGPTGPSTTPEWMAEGESPSSYFGFSVSTAGDVNGDGYDDVIVGAPTQLHEDGSQGSVFLYCGSPSGLTGPHWSARTFAPDTTHTFACFLSYAGDVNGDGFDDVAVSDYVHNGALPKAGAVWVYHGCSDGLEDSPAWFKEGTEELSYYGAGVSSAGDVNADGYDDLVIGASHFNDTVGRAYLYCGSAGGLSPVPCWTKDGFAAGWRFGTAVSLAGDVNGDGYGDVLVGSLNSAHLFLGNAAGLESEEFWTRQGETPTAYFGCELSTAGDVNGDGLADFLIGEPHSMEAGGIGKVNLYYGTRLDSIAAAPAWVYTCDQADARLGETVACAGDVNGDGFGDFLTGAYFYSDDQEWEGRAYLFLGSGEGPRTAPGWVIEPNQTGAEFGYSVASVGDVNGDGCEDILVGAPKYDAGQVDEGVAFLFLGGRDGASISPDWWAESNQVGAGLGFSVAGAGDLDSDGYDDVVIGAPYYDVSGLANCGAAFVWRGTNAGPPPIGTPANSAWAEDGAQANTYYGQCVASAGDVNGDGYADLLISVPGYNLLGGMQGAAALYFGSPSGPPHFPDWLGVGAHGGARYGYSLACAGDVNGDMYSDVIVGSPYFQNGTESEGAVYLYYGGEEGPSETASWTAEGSVIEGLFGWSVASAGDVNGDSFSDILVGMPQYGDGLHMPGMAVCWYGSSSGPSGSDPSDADWRMFGNGDHDKVGYAVAPAGDADNDGYSDVIVSAPYATWGGVAEAGAVAFERGSPEGILFTPPEIGGRQAGAMFGQSIAAADVNGDGFSDVLIGAPKHDEGQTDEGRAFLHYGNLGRGLRRSPDQWRADHADPIPLLAFSESWGGFGLHAIGRSAAGRTDVRMEWEVARFGTSFDGGDIEAGTTYDTGLPDPSLGSSIAIEETVSGLVGPRGWCWRMRIASRNPYFPRTPWFHATGNGAAEMDLRTPASPAALDDPGITAPVASRLALACTPNPFRAGATIAWTQPANGTARVTVHDVQGRLVRTLIDEMRDAGEHRLAWDGTRGDGQRVEAGAYWIRLRAGEVEEQVRAVRIE